MRFTSLFGLACLTAATFAAPIEQISRGFDTFERAFSKIQTNLRGLTVAIKDLDTNSRRGGQDLSRQEQDIERRAADVTQSLRDGTNSIRRTSMLSPVETTATVGPLEELGVVTQRAVDAWIQAKPSVLRAGGRQAVLRLLTAQETATDEFVDAVNAKVPMVTIMAARLYGQRARNQVDLAIAAYNKP
ncbi:hypothetical protein E2P81_ATG00419 [Venturia nashicola]|nr:hypothetical protein E2P81_ATG00419 [Venturia nashicola]